MTREEDLDNPEVLVRELRALEEINTKLARKLLVAGQAGLELKTQNALLTQAVRGFAKLNCAKGPMGKHYKDEVYCGICTSCRARQLLKDLHG